jgi:4-hydroxy-tetrahydrodipicolinate reductase
MATAKWERPVEQVAVARGHQITLKVDAANAAPPPPVRMSRIEFSRPDQAVQNIELCLKSKVPVVVGTTGWYDQLRQSRQW